MYEYVVFFLPELCSLRVLLPPVEEYKSREKGT